MTKINNRQVNFEKKINTFSYSSLEDLAFDQLTISNKELIAPCTPKTKVNFILFFICNICFFSDRTTPRREC
jgi:hypothetical protein